MTDGEAAKALVRLLKFLSRNRFCKATAFDDGTKPKLLLVSDSGQRLLCLKPILERGIKSDLLVEAQGCYSLSPLGRKRLARIAAASGRAEDNPFAAQHRATSKTKITKDGDLHCVTVNHNESPLSRLKMRKMASGEPWISDAAYAAGERLRSDFTRGQLSQKVTSSWDPSSGGGKSGGMAGGGIDITDAAIDARSRMKRALEPLGPELAGLITDVCCFLKGLESVERERRWPPRSAKLMLRVGLDLLARHYGTSTSQSSGKKDGIRQWGADGYRPIIQ